MEIVNGWNPIRSVLDVWQVYEYASELLLLSDLKIGEFTNNEL